METESIRPAVLKEQDAAIYCGVSVGFLRHSRLDKPRTSGPPFIKIGKAVRYLVKDLDAWLAASRVTPERKP
jgi:hypothetical protein